MPVLRVGDHFRKFREILHIEVILPDQSLLEYLLVIIPSDRIPEDYVPQFKE